MEEQSFRIDETTWKRLVDLAEEIADTMNNATGLGDFEDVLGWTEALAAELRDLLNFREPPGKPGNE